MVDLTMPVGLDAEGERLWLLGKGQELRDTTGQPSGVVDQATDGHPVAWGIWWSDNEE